MKPLLGGLDLVLAATLLGLAWAVLFSRGRFRAVVLFVALGLVMALVWVRLAAPEVALAEAAIGAGITGAMLLAALPRPGIAKPRRRSRLEKAAINTAGAGVLLLMAGAAYLLLALPPGRIGPGPATLEAMEASGVTNRVTAVLLNFRSFDTLLELAVLLLAVIGAWALGRWRPQAAAEAVNPILLTLVRGVMPLGILIAGYLTWIGDWAPGGAFQGGAILGAAAILLALVGRPLPDLFPHGLLRLVLVAGLLVFLGLGALPLGLGLLFLQYPPQQAGGIILAIEAAAALSIGLALALLVYVQQQRAPGPEPPPGKGESR
jgi:multisubunit Na+/H+ antiporter MnhB subunit